MAFKAPTMDEVRRNLAERDSIKIRMRAIFDHAFNFREKIWSDDEKFWESAETKPLKFKARYADMTNIFNKPWAAKMMEEREGERRGLSMKQLEALNLSPEQIEKLAELEEGESGGQEA